MQPAIYKGARGPPAKTVGRCVSCRKEPDEVELEPLRGTYRDPVGYGIA